MDISLTKHLCIRDRLMILFIYRTRFLNYLKKNFLRNMLIKVFNKSATFCDSTLMGQINFTPKPFFCISFTFYNTFNYFCRVHVMRDGYEIKHYRIKETGFNPIKPFLFLQPEGKNMST